MTGDDEDDANRTMVVPRPAGGPRLPAPPPPGGTGNGASEAADRHSTTVPGRLPGRGPATPPPPGPGFTGNGPAPMPGPPATPPHPDPLRPGPLRPGPFLPPGDGAPGGSPSLGTDLFAMQSPGEPDAKTQVRVLVTMGIALFGVLALILLGVFIFAK